MLERRFMYGFFILSTICLSLWIISLPSLIETEFNYSSSQYQSLQYSAFSKQNDSYELIIQRRFAGSLTTSTLITTSSNERRMLNNLHKNSNSLITNNLSTLSLSNLTPSPKITTTTETSDSSHLLLSSSLSSTSGIVSSIDYSSLSKDDFITLIDLNNFEFLINQPACITGGSSSSSASASASLSLTNQTLSSNKNITAPVILMLVHSAPKNFEKRLLIRRTWGSIKTFKFRLIFLLGDFNSTTLQQNVKIENEKYADIIQGNFVDTYKNMTYKHMMALKWYTYYCPYAQYLVKVDDDVFVNTIELIEFLENKHNSNNLKSNNKETDGKQDINTNINNNSNNNYNNNNNNNNSYKLLNKVNNISIYENNQLMETRPRRNNFLFCQQQTLALVKRSFRSKWRVSPKEYRGRYYPPYCPGYSIVYSSDVAYRLYVEGQKSPYFWIDDVHITGTLAQKANISITSFESYLLPFNKCKDILDGKTDIRTFTFLFTVPELDSLQIKQLWNININAYQQNHSSISIR